jgi:ABC-type transporter MlaC component
MTTGPAAAGVPKEIQSLIDTFNKARDQFLAQQAALLAQLKSATTASEREQIRLQVQANRQSFLATLKDFREQLKAELAALKGKISHEEFLRIIDAAHNAQTEGGIGHHKGH